MASLPRAAWVLWLAVVVLSVAASALTILVVVSTGAGAGGLDVYTVVFLVLAPIYATVGVTILARTTGNQVGWVLLLIGVLLSTENFSSESGTYATTSVGRWVPGGVWMNWISSWIWVPGVVGALALLPLLFPNGRLPSRRWQPLAWVVCGATTVSLGGFIFTPAGITGASSYVNPVGLAVVIPVAGLFHALYVLALLVGVVAGAGSLLVRYRRGTSDERHQIKWFAAAFVLLTVMLAAYTTSRAGGIVWPDWLIAAIICVGLTVVPLTVAVAVLRYRLYDIDVVLNRALVYGVLALFITVVYVGIAVGIGALIGGGGKPNLGLSILATAIVAVGFQPVRERLQRIANRLVYGNRATPYEVLTQFSERVAESYAMNEVMPRMARVLAEGTGADRADVWLRGGTTWREAAVWPPGASLHQAVPVDGDRLPLVAGSDRMVAVRHQGDLLGALSVTKRGGESLTPVEENLLTHLAGQAGLVVKNVGLTADLKRRLDELRASRQRLVTAQDEERRRLERNLHDGAQQHLVALKVKMGLVEVLMERNPGKAKAMLVQLKGDADEALQTLRDLARGIYPPLLAEKGLTAALEAHARKATVPVTVSADDLDRHTQETEAAVYFCVLEALQNAQKYASAGLVRVSLTESNGKLIFDVRDDGVGFDVATSRRGSGLVNMEDRLEALGGHLTVRSVLGSGTTLHGEVPTGIGALNPPYASHQEAVAS